MPSRRIWLRDRSLLSKRVVLPFVALFLCIVWTVPLIDHPIQFGQREILSAGNHQARRTAPQRQCLTKNNSVSQTDTTLVTAYFDLSQYNVSAKHGSSTFYEWAEGVLSLNSKMVIFTDTLVTYKLRHQHAPDSPTRIVYIDFRNLTTVKKFLPRMEKVYARDVHRRIIACWLYAVYYAKLEFMERAIKLNPFRTSKFLYLDIGSMRSEAMRATFRGRVFPSVTREPLLGHNDKVTFFSVGGEQYGQHLYPCPAINWRLSTDLRSRVPKTNNPSPQILELFKHPANLSDPPVFIVGGFFGGSAANILRLHKLFYSRVDLYLAREQSAYNLADQAIFVDIACTNPDLVQVIRPVLRDVPDEVRFLGGGGVLCAFPLNHIEFTPPSTKVCDEPVRRFKTGDKPYVLSICHLITP